MVHWHLSWLVYLFVELKTGAAIDLAGSALRADAARGFRGRTTGGSVTSLLRLPPQAPAGFSGS